MRVLLDSDGLRDLTLISGAQYDDTRRYYISKRARALVVARNGLQLGIAMAGRVIDAAIGWDAGTPGFVLERNEGAPHSKMTIYRELAGQHYDLTLSEFIKRAPRALKENRK